MFQGFIECLIVFIYIHWIYLSFFINWEKIMIFMNLLCLILFTGCFYVTLLTPTNTATVGLHGHKWGKIGITGQEQFLSLLIPWMYSSCITATIATLCSSFVVLMVMCLRLKRVPSQFKWVFIIPVNTGKFENVKVMWEFYHLCSEPTSYTYLTSVFKHISKKYNKE